MVAALAGLLSHFLIVFLSIHTGIYCVYSSRRSGKTAHIQMLIEIQNLNRRQKSLPERKEIRKTFSLSIL